MRDGGGEEEMDVLLLKFGDELAKSGDERRLLLEFMEGGILGKLTKVEEGEAEMDIGDKKRLSLREGGRGREKPHTRRKRQHSLIGSLSLMALLLLSRRGFV